MGDNRRSMRKRLLDAHRRDARARAGRARPELYLILDCVRSMHNVGAIFRTADGFGCRRLVLGGYTPSPPRPEIAKTALGADETVEFESAKDPGAAVLRFRHAGVQVVAVEQTHDSVSVFDFAFDHPLALIIGNEVDGVSDALLDMADAVVEIPMIGAKHSHNVAVATGIVLGEVFRQGKDRGQ